MDAERIAEMKRLCDEAQDRTFPLSETHFRAVGRLLHEHVEMLSEALAHIAERNEMIDALQAEIVALREDVEKAEARVRQNTDIRAKADAKQSGCIICLSKTAT